MRQARISRAGTRWVARPGSCPGAKDRRRSACLREKSGLALLLALLVALPILPAAAQRSDGPHAGRQTFHGARHGYPFAFHRPRPGFQGGPFANVFPGYWGWGGWGWGWDGGEAWDGPGAWPNNGAAAPPSPPPRWVARFTAASPPSTETTPQGVTIIRGPGSHHFPP